MIWDVLPPPPEIYNLQYSEQTLPDGSVVFLGAKIAIQENGWVRMSVFDKTLEWNFPVVRYTHSFSNTPKHQSTGIFQGQLIRFRNICNSIKDFKIATTTLTIRMLQREHQSSDISKAWNYYLMKFSNDKKTNYPKFRGWFRRILHWALYAITIRQKPTNNAASIVQIADNHVDTNQNTSSPVESSPVANTPSTANQPSSTANLPSSTFQPSPAANTSSPAIQPSTTIQSSTPISPSNRNFSRFHSSSTVLSIDSYNLTSASSNIVHQENSNNKINSDNHNSSSQESDQASSLDDNNSGSDMQPPENLPFTKELFEQYKDDDDLFAIRDQLKYFLRIMETRHSSNLSKPMNTCNKCWQQFKSPSKGWHFMQISS